MKRTLDAEQIVDQMIQRGSQIMRDAIEEYKPLAVIACYSGGNDSIVSTHFAAAEFGAGVAHCNTTIGVQRTREHVRTTCQKQGWQLTEKFAPEHNMPEGFDESMLPSGKWTEGATPYETFVLNFGFPGPGQHGRMYQRLKERSIDALVREIKQGNGHRSHVLLVSGIRHDESAIRAGYKRAVQKDGGKVWVNPFYFETAESFELYRQEFGLPRNPVSTKIGISGECLCGAFAKLGEKELVRSVEPATAEYIDQLEAKVQSNGFPWCWGTAPPAWWVAERADKKAGQMRLFDEPEPSFQPMCVGCVRRRSA